MRNISYAALILSMAGLISGACASVKQPEDTDGTGGAASVDPGAGGTVTSGSGGVVVIQGTGGKTSDNPICDTNETIACADVIPAKPVGTAVCTSAGTAWDFTGCSFCEPEATRPCAEDPPGDPPRTKGSIVCATSGDSWDDSACEVCSLGDPLACSDIPEAVSAGKAFGNALCNAAGQYDTATCGECDESDSDFDDIACTEITGHEVVYTGGTATCSAGIWDISTCDFCGNDIKSSEEACDGTDTTPTTCGALGYAGEVEGTAVDACLSSCDYDSSPCGSCTADIVDEAKCLEDENCSGAACIGAQCGRSTSCVFNCSQADGCTGISCAEGSDCDVNCNAGGGSTCDVVCMDSATCDVNAQSSRPIDIGCESGSECNVACAPGATCDIDCQTGADCSNTGSSNSTVNFACQSGATCHFAGGSGTTSTLNCESGSACSMDVTQSGATAAGIAYCADASCSYTFTAQSTHTVDIVCEDGGICDVTMVTSAHISDITCESGSTCTINCGSNSTCTNIRCEDGADCSITCGGSNCAYKCETPEDCSCTGSNCNESAWD